MPQPLFISLALGAAMMLAACSSPSNDGGGDEEKGAADTAGIPPALAGETGFALATDCAAKLKSVSRLYGILAQQSSGTDAEELANRGVQREAAATAFAQIAERVAGTIGKTPEQAAQAIRDADAAVQSEFDKRPFEDFATWVTSEVDTKCRDALTGTN